MATQQATPTATTTPADPSAPSDAPPAYSSSQQSVQSPIGVPFFQIDPTTGQPYPDQRRWGAYVPSNPQGSEGTQGPGTATSYGHQPGSGYQFEFPRYFEGEQWLPAQLPPDKMYALQQKMVDAGLLKPGEAQMGMWDMASVNAYYKLLAFANASGLDAEEALNKWATIHKANPNGGGPSQPLVTKVSNPDDLRLAFRKAVIDTLGQGWDQSKIDQMVNAYQQTERSAQQQQYQMTGSGSPTDPGTGGEIVTPPSPQTFAETQARTENPTQAQEHDTLGFINQFRQMVGGWTGANG